MDLSIITVNYRSWAHLDRLLTGLLGAAEFADGVWEFIVIDNDSADDRLAGFRQAYPQVQCYLNTGNFGFAHGNNLGARHAMGRSLLFLNPDMRVVPEAIRRLLATRQAYPEFKLLTSIQENENGRLQKAFDRFPDLLTYSRAVRGLLRIIAPASNPDPRRPHAEIVECDWISGSLLLIGRPEFDRLAGWSEDFWMYAEDMDLCRRAAALDMRRGCAPIAGFVHVHGGASRRDAATRLLTKTEVMISAHVYVNRHFRGMHGLANQAIVMMRNLVPLSLAGIANLLTLGQVSGLRLRGALWVRLCRYYISALKHRSWLSPRSVNSGRAAATPAAD